MSHPSPLPLLALHCLRLKGFADTATIAEVAQAPVGEIDDLVARLAADGYVHQPGSGVLGWALTTEGRAENQRLLGLEVELVGARAVVEAAHRRFLTHNEELRALCTRWQVRGDSLNDHRDASYDEDVLVALGALHRRARRLCVELRDCLARFGGYEPRLAAALTRLRDGDTAWFTQPLIDSYHTVWFELHEDLLATLGIDRAAEATRT